MASIFTALRGNTVAIFKRPTDKLAPIDGIRALSQLGVMLYHCFFLIRLALPKEQFQSFVESTPAYFGWIWNLDYTVDAFFVISGFLIASMLFREHQRSGTIDMKRFYWRRYLRLTPAYFAFIGLYLLLSKGAEPNIWANLLYVNNFITLPEMSIPWTWSLAVEEQFYLIFPAILLLFVLRGGHALRNMVILLGIAIFTAAAVVWSDAELWNTAYTDSFYDKEKFVHYYDRFYVNLYTRFGPFVSGAIAACVVYYWPQQLENLRNNRLLFNGISLLALLILGSKMAINPYTQDVSLMASRFHIALDRNIFGIALAWVMLASLGKAGIVTPVQKFLSMKIWYPVAQLAYSMYLLHYLVVSLVLYNVAANLKYYGMLNLDAGFPYEWLIVAYAIVVIVCFPLSMILYVLIEKPFINLRDRLSEASRSQPAQPVLQPSTN